MLQPSYGENKIIVPISSYVDIESVLHRYVFKTASAIVDVEDMPKNKIPTVYAN